MLHVISQKIPPKKIFIPLGNLNTKRPDHTIYWILKADIIYQSRKLIKYLGNSLYVQHYLL